MSVGIDKRCSPRMRGCEWVSIRYDKRVTAPRAPRPPRARPAAAALSPATHAFIIGRVTLLALYYLHIALQTACYILFLMTK